VWQSFQDLELCFSWSVKAWALAEGSGEALAGYPGLVVLDRLDMDIQHLWGGPPPAGRQRRGRAVAPRVPGIVALGDDDHHAVVDNISEPEAGSEDEVWGDDGEVDCASVGEMSNNDEADGDDDEGLFADLARLIEAEDFGVVAGFHSNLSFQSNDLNVLEILATQCLLWQRPGPNIHSTHKAHRSITRCVDVCHVVFGLSTFS
jgi:hypothetical protein